MKTHILIGLLAASVGALAWALWADWPRNDRW